MLAARRIPREGNTGRRTGVRAAHRIGGMTDVHRTQPAPLGGAADDRLAARVGPRGLLGAAGGSRAGTSDQTASVTLRVPAARFDELITRLQELPDVELVSMSPREEDVTRQIVDLDARIRNLEASEASYRALLERAERIEDVLTVQGRLDEVRGQIEQLEAQLQAIEGQAALSTLTVTIIPREEPVAEVQSGWDPGAQAKSAVATLVGIAQGLFDALTWIVIVVLPISLVAGVITLFAIRLLPDLRRRIVPAPTDAS